MGLQLFLLQEYGEGVVGDCQLQFVILSGEVCVLIFKVFFIQIEFHHQFLVGLLFGNQQNGNSNDSLSVLLEQEQLKTQRLLEELRTVKSSNATEIRRLKKELASLRKVMIGYINQIDSLNRLTAQQKEIIADVTKKYNAASRQISNLSEEKKNLTKSTERESLETVNFSSSYCLAKSVY